MTLKSSSKLWMAVVFFILTHLIIKGTNEDTLTEIIGSRSNGRLQEIKKLYKEKHNETLEQRIKEEASAEYRNLIVSILQCNRNTSSTVDQKAVKEDVEDLYNAGEGKWGTGTNFKYLI